MKLFAEIFPNILFEASSNISGPVKVVGVGRVRKLIVGGLVQSVNYRAKGLENKVWGRLSRFPDGGKKNPAVLILGLGGGTVAHLLDRSLKPSRLVGVEIDPLIIEAGWKFFDLGKIKNLEVIRADARDFIRKNKELFDFVIVDTYRGDRFPKFFEQPPFLRQLGHTLQDGGLVVFNRIFSAKRPQRRIHFLGSLERGFSEVRQEIIESPADYKNYLIWAKKS